jgi:hypothetical protein
MHCVRWHCVRVSFSFILTVYVKNIPYTVCTQVRNHYFALWWVWYYNLAVYCLVSLILTGGYMISCYLLSCKWLVIDHNYFVEDMLWMPQAYAILPRQWLILYICWYFPLHILQRLWFCVRNQGSLKSTHCTSIAVSTYYKRFLGLAGGTIMYLLAFIFFAMDLRENPRLFSINKALYN